MSTGAQIEPGWYPDAQGTVRWWNGTQWASELPPAATPPPNARSRPRIELIRLAAALIGGVLVIIAFTSTWLVPPADYRSFGAHNYSFGDLGSDPSVEAFARTYFSWLGWLLFVLAVLCCATAAIPSPARQVCMASGVLLGIAGFLLTTLALALLARQLGLGFSDFVSWFGTGPWLASIGFAVLAVGPVIGGATTKSAHPGGWAVNVRG